MEGRFVLFFGGRLKHWRPRPFECTTDCDMERDINNANMSIFQLLAPAVPNALLAVF